MSGEQLIQFMSGEQLIQFYVRRTIDPILCRENN